MSDTHQLDKAVALLKSLAADHERGDGTDHEWRTCRACLASEELGYAKVGDLSSPAQRLLRLLITELDALAALRQRHATAEAAYQEAQITIAGLTAERDAARVSLANVQAENARLRSRMSEAALNDDCHHCDEAERNDEPCWWCGRIRGAALEGDHDA